MRRWRIWLVLTLAALAAAVSTVGAAAAGGPEAGRPPIAAGEEQVIIPEGERLEDDLVVNAEKGAAVYGTLAGDLILLGADAVITGTVEGDVIGYANRVWISGQVLGNVRVLALEAVTIEGRVGRSAITVSQRATLGPEAEIGTTWFALSGDVELGGTVGRSLFATASRVTVSGRSAGISASTGTTRPGCCPAPWCVAASWLSPTGRRWSTTGPASARCASSPARGRHSPR